MKFNWSYSFQTPPYIASKLNVTLVLTIISAIFSFVIGVVFAIISYHRVKSVSQVLKIWISFVRGTSVAAQLFFFHYGLANLSSLIFNMSPIVVAAVTMGLNIGTFVPESIHGALTFMDEGQREAAAAFGMTGFRMTVRIVIPQATRVALPPLFNDLINLFKMSSLAFLVGARDVMEAARTEGVNTFQSSRCYACVMLVYWVIILILTAIQKVLEKRYNAISQTVYL